VTPAGKGAAVTWRGRRDGKLVRQLVVLREDLSPAKEPIDLAAASCATDDGVWSADVKGATFHSWADAGGPPARAKVASRGDADVSVECGAKRAYAIADDDEGMTVTALGGSGAGQRVFEAAAFGDDDARERVAYTIGDDAGFLRLAVSGALAVRELRAGALGPLRRTTASLPADADLVAVDASPKTLVVVYTEDVSASCPDAGVGTSSTKVSALRVDRSTWAESSVTLSSGTCGREVGPFFTGALGDGVSVAWVERVPVHGQARAPIAALAHALVPPSPAAPAPVARLETAADALSDAGCDATRCFAVALGRREGMDAMVPGVARLLRYP
jgi:hypothetical protein